MPADRDYIVLYRKLVERKFFPEKAGERLTQRDLEYLGLAIEERSKVKLSISTLKRLWRNEVSQLPHPSTLDALVSILDFSNWQEFKKHHAGVAVQEPPARRQGVLKLKGSLPIAVIIGLLLLVAGLIILQGFIKKEGVVVSGTVAFTADKTVTLGVPNTVMFHYDISNVQADSFFIQQSWNPRDKTKIDPSKNYYSAIYYTPGFHWARIIANDSILKFVSVHIKTQGWLPVVRYDSKDKRVMYLDTSAVKSNGMIQTNPEILYKANVDVSRDFYLRYYNVRDFEGVTSNNFDLETRLRCDNLSIEGRSSKVPCPRLEIIIITEEDVFFIPFTTKGCVSELDLRVGEVYQDGKDNDLSRLGTDVYEWQTIRIKNENKKTTLFLNGSPVHSLEYKRDFGKINGIFYNFIGPGSVDYLRIRDLQGATVYQDEFLEPG